MNTIGRTYFHKARSGLLHHIGDAETPAYLHQLRSSDNYRPAAGKSRKRKHDCRSIIVDHQGCTYAGYALQQRLNVHQSSAALPFAEIIF
jgi:hypothetical protein